VSDLLEPSAWTVLQARRMARNMIDVVDGETYDAVEHFSELCEHLDELYGGYGFTRLLEPPQRAAVADLIRSLRGRRPTGAAVLDDDGRPVDLQHPEADPYFDTVIRLHQPVNSSLTLDQGRHVAADLASRAEGEEWLVELGRAMQGLYRYLDQLYGGPGAFTELLDSEDRARVAQLVVSLTVT
jgi:hypothetical protein